MSSHPVFNNNVANSSNDIFNDFSMASPAFNSTGDTGSSPKKASMTQSTTMPLIPSSNTNSSSSSMNTHTMNTDRRSSSGMQPARNTTNSRNDLMSSLLSSNLSQMGGAPSTPTQPAMMMPFSASMPMGLSGANRANGSVPVMNRSPTIGLTGMTPSSGTSQQQPMQNMSFPQQTRHATPSTFPTIPGGNSSFGVMQPTSSSLNPVKPNVKSLSKRDIDDLLS